MQRSAETCDSATTATASPPTRNVALTRYAAIEDTVFRLLLNGAELSTHARKLDGNITIFKAHSRRRSI